LTCASRGVGHKPICRIFYGLLYLCQAEKLKKNEKLCQIFPLLKQGIDCFSPNITLCSLIFAQKGRQMATAPTTIANVVQEKQEVTPVVVQMDWPTTAAILTVVLGILALVKMIISRKKEEKLSVPDVNRVESNRIRDEIKVEIDDLYETLEKVRKEVHEFDKENIRSGGDIKRLDENIDEIRTGLEKLEGAMDNCPVWEMEKDVREMKVRIENLENSYKSSTKILNQLSAKIDKVNDLLIDWLKDQ